MQVNIVNEWLLRLSKEKMGVRPKMGWERTLKKREARIKIFSNWPASYLFFSTSLSLSHALSFILFLLYPPQVICVKACTGPALCHVWLGASSRTAPRAKHQLPQALPFSLNSLWQAFTTGPQRWMRSQYCCGMYENSVFTQEWGKCINRDYPTQSSEFDVPELLCWCSVDETRLALNTWHRLNPNFSGLDVIKCFHSLVQRLVVIISECLSLHCSMSGTEAHCTSYTPRRWCSLKS